MEGRNPFNVEDGDGIKGRKQRKRWKEKDNRKK